MAIRSTKGIRLYLTNTNATTVDVAAGDFTALTNANPPVATVTDVTGITAGDLVMIDKTDITAIDGRFFVVGTVDGTANTFEVKGIDLTSNTGTFNAATAIATVYPKTSAMTPLCLASIGVNIDTPAQIQIGTYCDPSASIPGSSTSAGTLDLTAYHDPSDAGFKLLIEAEEKGDQHTMLIEFPGNQGWLVAKGVIASMQISDLPLDGATAWSASMSLSSKPHMLF